MNVTLDQLIKAQQQAGEPRNNSRCWSLTSRRAGYMPDYQQSV